jgi:hypothetical protein
LNPGQGIGTLFPSEIYSTLGSVIYKLVFFDHFRVQRAVVVHLKNKKVQRTRKEPNKVEP